MYKPNKKLNSPHDLWLPRPYTLFFIVYPFIDVGLKTLFCTNPWTLLKITNEPTKEWVMVIKST